MDFMFHGGLFDCMISPQSYSGFYKTPISKCILAFTVCSYFILQMPLAKYRDFFVYDLDDILTLGSVWRVFTSKMAFLDTKDLVVGSLLLYYFRIFERRYGPQKFLSSLLCGSVLTVVLELLCAICLRSLGFSLHTLPSGPFSVIYPFFVPYFWDIPRFPVASILGFPITGKSFPYIFGLQLASSSYESMLVYACGLLAGIIYQEKYFGMCSWRLVPSDFVAFVSRFLGPVICSPPPAMLYKPLGATLELQHQELLDHQEQSLLEARRINMRGNVTASAVEGSFSRRMFGGLFATGGGTRRDYTPSDEDVRLLVEMGFPLDRSVQALRLSGGDASYAVTLLHQDVT